ncbi:uncharacterized protein LOC100175658 [Ciona intestinalis]
MKINLFIFVICVLMSVASSKRKSSVDCNFDGRRAFCRWKREWFEMRRAGWRAGSNIRGSLVRDVTSGGEGKIAFVQSRSRPEGFRSRLRSARVAPDRGSCFVFHCAIGGSEWSYPDGLPLLRVFIVEPGQSPDRSVPVVERGEKIEFPFQKFITPVDESLDAINGDYVQFIIEVVSGASKKSFVAIDDVKLQPCDEARGSIAVPEFDVQAEARQKMNDVTDDLMEMMLPALRGDISVFQFPDASEPRSLLSSSGNFSAGTRIATSPILVRADDYAAISRRRERRKRRKNRRKKLRRRNKGRKQKKKKLSRTHGVTDGVVFLQESPTRGTTGIRTGNIPSPTIPRMAMCDFIEYTHRLKRCFRSFFFDLQRQPHNCRTLYDNLENCVLFAASSCVPSHDMTSQRVEEIVMGNLRTNFKMKQVYCEEEGAFVFPKFAVDTLPIQCGPRYFIKLSECGGPFRNIFNIQHGNPRLCSEYYQANECQRQTTAEECNFDTETMLLYGLNLQYQFAHNPFCVHLPFSAWWPET